MHIALLAGEPSGDQLGAELIKSLRNINTDIYFDGVGGPLMQAQGFNSLLSIENFTVMGLAEVLYSLPRLLYYRRKLINTYKSALPDIFIGIDYPEFNLSLERQLKGCGIYTVHYVSPSIWAWREKRIKHIKRSCDLMLTLFAFEKKFYDKHKMPAVHCGHPLADIMQKPKEYDTEEAKSQLELTTDKSYLAILPGSREGEVKKMLPIFIEVAKKLYKLLPQLKCLIPAANKTLLQIIHNIMQDKANGLPYVIYLQKAKQVMTASDAILLTSGTATLEAMLLQKPMLISYKVNAMTAIFARRMIKIPHFSLPNILADNPPIVPEFMQEHINTSEMSRVLQQLIMPTEIQKRMISQLADTRKKLQEKGASYAAKAILNNFSNREIIL